ncbi:hypothetical protein N2K95_01255 [Arthrobacter zhaoxinii]|uniref:Uncharacterized protein n=1 Tax=Arthrobacter zhaoxinii TaxID=2964616 RepID=A0ABY5YRC1_9MICC|nr:hypothetical protein [Arthrobacter zhaoxinii]UWX97355.1 hypothetical protein N2K95_01255 [Arthrobacter zhaoxinii]
METLTQAPLKLLRPTVYLDQWVWIRLAKADAGSPKDMDDLRVLAAVRRAVTEGICFPLSATHYEETVRIRDYRQRQSLMKVMAPVSLMQTFRAHNVLLRHQFLVALHETVGRPTFRPANPEVIGIGVHWAMVGSQAFYKVLGADNQVISSVSGAWLRHLNQYAEAAVLAGPNPGELPGLLNAGYLMPRTLENQENSRLAYEQWLKRHLADQTTDPRELRAIIMAREISHEYSDLLGDIFGEYRLSFSTIADGRTGMAMRAKAIAFIERVPTARISTDLKTQLFRNKQRNWDWNMIRDIDALSLAVPYSHIVVADKDAASLLRRTEADKTYRTTVIEKLGQLPELLDELSLPSTNEGTLWDELGPDGDRYQLESPPALSYDTSLKGASLRLVDAAGRLMSGAGPGRNPIRS